MDSRPVGRKPWAVLAYTVADDKGSGDSLDDAAKEELRSLCNAADFGQMSVAAQVDFKHARGVFRSVLTEAPPKTRGFEAIPADSHPLWRSIKAKLDRSKLRVLRETADLNASRGAVLTSFLRFGEKERPANRCVIFFYGHGYGPLGLFFDAEADDTSATSTMTLTSLSDSLHVVGERAAVIVFRACLANTLETAYQLREAGEFMLASQSIVPIAGIWPWATFLTSLMAGASSEEVARAIGQQLALFLETPANRDPFADVPYGLIDLARRGGHRRAAQGHRRYARRRPHRRRPHAPVRRRAGSGPRRLSRRLRQPRQSGAARRLDDVREPGQAGPRIRSPLRPARSAPSCRASW